MASEHEGLIGFFTHVQHNSRGREAVATSSPEGVSCVRIVLARELSDGDGDSFRVRLTGMWSTKLLVTSRGAIRTVRALEPEIDENVYTRCISIISTR